MSELIVLPAVQGISWCEGCHLNISMWMSAVKKKSTGGVGRFIGGLLHLGLSVITFRTKCYYI